MLMTDQERIWLRFEGPGKLHVRHWHIGKPFPPGGWATLCGIVVQNPQLVQDPGDGPRCVSCEAAAMRQAGGHL